MRVSHRHGRLRLRLEAHESQLLATLLDELGVLVSGPGAADDEVLRRLNPAAYPDDEQAEREYRTLTEASLRTDRNERLAACRSDLASGSDIDLSDPDAGRRWIQVLNDLRLALGTRLGVTEEDDHDVDATDPREQPRLIYYWLTAVQDSVVHGLMR